MSARRGRRFTQSPIFFEVGRTERSRSRADDSANIAQSILNSRCKENMANSPRGGNLIQTKSRKRRSQTEHSDSSGSTILRLDDEAQASMRSQAVNRRQTLSSGSSNSSSSTGGLEITLPQPSASVENRRCDNQLASASRSSRSPMPGPSGLRLRRPESPPSDTDSWDEFMETTHFPLFNQPSSDVIDLTQDSDDDVQILGSTTSFVHEPPIMPRIITDIFTQTFYPRSEPRAFPTFARPLCFKFQKNKKTENEEDDAHENCVICLCDFEIDEDIKQLACSHLFHADCIDEWLRWKDNCPICRAHIPRREIWQL